MSIVYEEATPVKIQTTGGGRKAMPNPHQDIVNEIALKVDGDGQPIARAFVIDVDPTDEEKARKTVDRVADRLRSAGHAATPKQVTVRVNPTAVSPGKVRILFWTVPKIVRPRKTDK